MSATTYRLRAEARARWRPWIALAMLVGVAGGTVLALLAGARRTDSAYTRFLTAQQASDVMVVQDLGSFTEPGPPPAFDADALRQLPETSEVAEARYFYAFIGTGVGVLVPPNDDAGGVNQIKLLAGRPVDPNKPDEVVVAFTFAEQNHIGVGDRITLFDPNFDVAPGLTTEEVPASGDARRRIDAALPDGKATVVGIEAAPGEFPPLIEGTGAFLIHGSPALYPLAADLAGFDDGGNAYAVRLHAGAKDDDAFLAQLQSVVGPTQPVVLVQRDLAVNPNRSVHIQAVALQLLALLIAVAAALISTQLLARIAAIGADEAAVLSALGMTRRSRFTIGMLRAGAIAIVAAIVAVAVAVAASPLFPTGLARTAETSPGFDIDTRAIIFGAFALTVIVVLIAAIPTWRATRLAARIPEPTAARRRSLQTRVVSLRSFPVPAAIGVRMAFGRGRGRSALPVHTSLVGVTLGVTALVSALAFGSSLNHLLSTPRLYGQTWDAELTTYDNVIADRGAPLLEADQQVDGLAVGETRARFSINDQRVDGLVLDPLKGDLAPSILEGRPPTGPNEIALGTKTMRSLHVGLGDTIDVGGFATDRPPVSMLVVGRAVFPVLDEIAQLGDGVYVSVAGGAQIFGDSIDTTSTGLLVRSSSPSELDGVVDRLTDAIGPVAVIQPGRPNDIVNFGRVDKTPYIVGAILALLATATLAFLLVTATRRRRHEIAVLRTLGFVRGQVRGVVASQATTLIAFALVVGIPIGLAIGRSLWTLLADQLGVLPEPQVPWTGVALVVGAGLLLANLVALVPATLAVRTPPADSLRSE